MNKIKCIVLFISVVGFAFSNEDDKNNPVKSFDCNFKSLTFKNDSIAFTFVDNIDVYTQEWHMLNQPIFWKKLMTLSADSCVINIAKNRKVVEKMSVEKWGQKSEQQKDQYRDSIRETYNLRDIDKIYMTTGKADFYNFDEVIPSVSKGVEIFKNNNLHPWYAQAILLIESPGKLAKSNAGAYGAFQLMPSVARSHGLTVNKYKDERKDFKKSALAAISLIKNTCIPKTEEILKAKNLSYDKNSLSFRLLVLHVYHAGYANVKEVVNKINPKVFNGDLIQKMWVSKAANFGNASQNYSQLAIAAMLILDEIIESNT